MRAVLCVYNRMTRGKFKYYYVVRKVNPTKWIMDKTNTYKIKILPFTIVTELRETTTKTTIFIEHMGYSDK